MKDRIKKILLFISNPRLLLCVAIGWMITNGWSYLFLLLGSYFGIGWMVAVGTAYIAFLWMPISPEKIVTFAIAIALLKLLFPNDQRTLAVLTNLYQKAKALLKRRKDQPTEADPAEDPDSDFK